MPRRPRPARTRAALLALALALGLAPGLSSHATNLSPMASNPPASFFRNPPEIALERLVLADDGPGIADAIARGVSPDARGAAGATPLMVAVDNQRPHAVDALLRAGADPNAVSEDRRSPVYLATARVRQSPVAVDILRLLVRAGGSPDTRGPDRNPVIMQFVDANDCDGIRLMKSLGADLDIRDRGDDPIVTTAAASRDFDVVWCLLELGAAWDYENGKSRRPLSRAVNDRVPSPDSPLYADKVRVWHFLRDRGVVLDPLPR